MSDEIEDAMAELVPLDSPARHSDHHAMTPPREAHLSHVLRLQAHRTEARYRAGQAQHGGTLFTKPGMLKEALAESADLAVYLITLEEQMEDLAAGLRAGGITPQDAADALERMLRA